METASTTPVIAEVVDYTAILEEIKLSLALHSDALTTQTEMLRAIYVVMLFVLGVGGAILVLLTLYNLLKKCY